MRSSPEFRTSVILCAAGRGTRAGFEENKVLHELNGLSILWYSVSAFLPYADEILLVCREEDEEKIKKILSPCPPSVTLVLGGETRCESVYNALKRARGDIVLVHDAARPFISQNAIQVCISMVKACGSAICALPSDDTAGIVREGRIVSEPNRAELFTLQTPQGFFREELLYAYEKAKAVGFEKFTDESGIFGEFFKSPHIFMGERTNKKLTHPEDFKPAARAGFGVDTHAFGEGDSILLGGVRIPHFQKLLAHSDGDVLCHALMDALLSAIGERDIGVHFPDFDERFRGADSMKLLEQVMKMVHGCGFCVKNASISVLAEAPKLSPHIPQIIQNLRLALGCEEVAVAAGTNEKLGYVGEGKGITVFALVLLAEDR